MERTGLRALWERGQRGWPASRPLVQVPNAPLLVAFAAWIVGALTTGAVHDAARATFYLGLGIWAWLELTAGANGVRRVLGAGGLAFVVVRLAQAL